MPSTKISRRLHWLAHIGYASRGLLFLSIGVIALLASVDFQRETAGGTGALQMIQQTFGSPLLVALVLGLLSFAVWRILQALWDIDGLGGSPSAISKRMMFGFNGIFYLSAALCTLWILFESALPKGDDAQVRYYTLWTLQLPFGQWLLALIGITIVATGVGLGVKAWRTPLDQRLAVKPKVKKWLQPLNRYALLARGVILVLIGGSVIFAAIEFNFREAKGLAGTFAALRETSYGQPLLGIVALGFITYGCYEFAQAFWHRGRAR